MPKRFVPCPICHGRGSVSSGADCLECTGSGRVTADTARMLKLTQQAYASYCPQCTALLGGGPPLGCSQPGACSHCGNPEPLTMRLTRSHRKRQQLEEEIPEARFLIDNGRAWLYKVPAERVPDARAIGLTAYRKQS